MNIGILGMGGIGSFIGAKLANNYKDNKNVNIFFICRNSTKKNILTNGLTLKTNTGNINCKPYLTSDDPTEIGQLDILFITTKSFSLATALKTYESCINKNTVVIPLQNGVNAKSIITKAINISDTQILEGCIYVISNIEKPGVVKHAGGPGKILFGSTTNNSNHTATQELLAKGGLDITYTSNIKEIIWKKFLFVSTVATLTSALNITFGEMVNSKKHRNTLKNLMLEVKNLSAKFDVNLTSQNINDSLAMLSNFPSHSKSSLQIDLENKSKNTEKDILIDFVIDQAKAFDVCVDNYLNMNQKIIANYLS